MHLHLNKKKCMFLSVTYFQQIIYTYSLLFDICFSSYLILQIPLIIMSNKIELARDRKASPFRLNTLYMSISRIHYYK